jgi:peptide chain release factor 2
VLSKLYGTKGEVSFGYQIRNYVMNPYTIVKDARTEHETGDIQRVIAGEIDDFIEAYLKWFQGQKTAAQSSHPA